MDESLQTDEAFIQLGIEAFKVSEKEEYNPFDHPLSDGLKTIEVDSKKVYTVNSWTLAGMILEVICDPNSKQKRPSGLKNAIAMFHAAIKEANDKVDAEELLEKCFLKEEAALRQAQALIAFGAIALVSGD